MQVVLLLTIILAIVGFVEADHPPVAFVILTQPAEWHASNTGRLKKALLDEIPQALVFDTVSDFGGITGAWAVWPVLPRLYHQLSNTTNTVPWVFFCEDGTVVKGKKLVQFMQRFDPTKDVFLGHALRDLSATIIHHFAFIGENVSKFAYPDFAGGVAMSWPLVEKLVNKLAEGKKPRDFAIDAKHELAMLAWDDGAGSELTDVPEFCTTVVADHCITEFTNGDYQLCSTQGVLVTNDDVVFSVKTFHEFHKTRIVVVKRTWGLEARNIEYFSDREDHYIPAVTLGINNTERGHCEKTVGILKHFVANHADKIKWLVIADDDTLLSVPRLLQLLNCYNHKLPLLIGERYGFGFDSTGSYGYSYPTGGAGMIFSSAAASLLADQCQCPTADSPDDMILGICAKTMDIPLIHSGALHQARPNDYAKNYLLRTKPISFHKHWEVDPYAVYSEWLSLEGKISKDTDDEPPISHSHRGEL